MRFSLILLFATGSALAQFQDLATPDDGSVLYFSSALRTDRSSQNLYPKLFRMDPTGIHLYLQRAPGDSDGRTTPNFYELASTDLSADGKVLAYTASRPCYGGSGCLSVERSQGHIVGLPGQPELIFAGHVRISRNARYALTFGSSVAFSNPGTQLIDLQTGGATTLPTAYSVGNSSGRRRIAMDGTVVVSTDTQLALWRKSGVQMLADTQSSAEPMISDDATLVVYETGGTVTRLIAYDVKAARATTLASGDGAFHASMPGDGSLIAFLSHSQMWLVRADGSGPRQLTDDPAGIAEALLTGNGQVIYAVTAVGRILRVDVASGAIAELVPRTPNIQSIDAAVAGSQVRIEGTGLADAIASPLLGWTTTTGPPAAPDFMNGAQIKLGGVPMPLVSVTPSEIRWQVPWGWPAGDAPLQLLSGTSPFESGPGLLTVAPLQPGFYGGSDLLTAVHQAWDALVTTDNPAQSDEVLHVYLRGLGPVSPSVPTGMPAPATPLARVVTVPRCQFWDGGPNDAEVLSAALAPGMIGIYQMELRVPPGLRVSPVSVVCDYPSNHDILNANGLLPVTLAPH